MTATIIIYIDVEIADIQLRQLRVEKFYGTVKELLLDNFAGAPLKPTTRRPMTRRMRGNVNGHLTADVRTVTVTAPSPHASSNERPKGARAARGQQRTSVEEYGIDIRADVSTTEGWIIRPAVSTSCPLEVEPGTMLAR